MRSLEDTMRTAAGLPPESPEERHRREFREQTEEREKYNRDVKTFLHRNALACSMTTEIEAELRKIKLGPAEQDVVNKMVQGLLASTRAVAMNNPKASAKAYETAVRQHIDEWLNLNPTIGNVLKASVGTLDSMTMSIVDAVVAAVNIVNPSPGEQQNKSIDKTMAEAAGVGSYTPG